MSIEHFEHIPEQPEGVRGRPIAVALVSTIVGITACTLIVWALMSFHADGGGRSDEVHPALVPPASPFEGETPLELQLDARRAALESWSWADREHRIVRVPAEVAIDRYVGGAR